MYNGLALLKKSSLHDRDKGMRRTSETIDHHTGEKTTDKTQLKRAPIFVGILFLLYTVATGLWMHYSGETVAPEATRNRRHHWLCDLYRRAHRIRVATQGVMRH